MRGVVLPNLFCTKQFELFVQSTDIARRRGGTRRFLFSRNPRVLDMFEELPGPMATLLAFSREEGA